MLVYKALITEIVTLPLLFRVVTDIETEKHGYEWDQSYGSEFSLTPANRASAG